MGPPGTKSNNVANVDFQSSTNTRDGRLIKVQNLSSRNSKLEELFTDEIATYTSITGGIHSQYFFHTIKLAGVKLVIRILLFERFLQ